jgi:ribosomal protein L11 methylase PrmA
VAYERLQLGVFRLSFVQLSDPQAEGGLVAAEVASKKYQCLTPCFPHASLLEALEAFLGQWRGDAGPRVLDVGTGTGIIGIAAAVLGADRVIAIDTDPEACEAATKNLALNRVVDRVEVFHGGLEALGPVVRFDLIVANLDTKSLGPVLNPIKTLLTPHGRLVASGILVEEEETLSGATRAAGFGVLTRQSDNEWLCLTLEPE